MHFFPSLQFARNVFPSLLCCGGISQPFRAKNQKKNIYSNGIFHALLSLGEFVVRRYRGFTSSFTSSFYPGVRNGF